MIRHWRGRHGTTRPLLAALAAVVLAAPPAAAQIPGLRDAAGGLLGRVPSLSSFLEGDPPITTSLDDARTEIAFLDSWSPAGWERLDGLPRTGEGAFRLRPGRFAMEAESYCMHAGTHGPGGGDGYLYAPLAGSKAGIVQSLLRNSVAHPEVPQRDIQTLIWAIIARTEFDEMPREMQRTARTLLTRDQVDDLDDGALGRVPESVMREAMSRLPPVARQVFEAEARIRSMLSSGSSTFADLERIAVLTGAVEPPEGSRPVPEGRWSFDPGGYFVRYDPSGYSRTRVEVSVPGPVVIGRDAAGRISTVIGSDGARLDAGAGGLRHTAPGAPAEAIPGGVPAAGDRSERVARSVIAEVLGRTPDAGALDDLADIEALADAVRASGGAVGDGTAAPGGSGGAGAPGARALDLLAEAWQAAFCRAAGCPSTAAADDVLVLRDGTTLKGELQGCAAETCMFGYASFERDGIEWIGLDRDDPGPPAAVHADVGEVHRIEGTVRAGDLVGVGERRVVTDRGGHDRPDVTWIHLVPGEEERAAEPPAGGGGGAEPAEPPPPADPPDDGDDDEDDDEDGPPDDADEPVFDPSDDVATPGNRARQRLAQSGRSTGGGGGAPAPPGDDRCAGERRNLRQAEARLELHDLQMQSLEDRYDTLYDQLAAQSQEFDELHAAAQQEYNEFRNDVLFQAFQNIVGAFLPVPPDQGSISAAQSVIGFYDFYTANSGTISDMRAWAQSQGGMTHLLRMLDHMDSMYRTMGRMTRLKHEYDEMEVNREPLEDSVEEARRLLEACMGAVG